MTTTSRLTGDYVIDQANTHLGFVARHTVGPRVRGRFDKVEGHVHLDGQDPARSSIAVTIRADSIETHNRQRDLHLRTKFFACADHPVITFTSTTVAALGENRFDVTGVLMIRGLTKLVKVRFELFGEQDRRLRFGGTAAVNRMDWGVDWNVATGMFVSPTVTLHLDVSVYPAATR
ncbi:YceI family protein [Kribbella albertanoniae]|uniref:Polyisoprenoid-binding protein n=1 Tax=Kribbella albertanoniae TaxID=1266829 RepID=A0A4R4QHL9_9ACTN|nr:YceI family protein [Kribbella albertanoniae]TDC35050.1 polyisoprenoid-binding protein [Kribbella albertanoniae]